MMLDWYYSYQAYVIKLHQNSNKAITERDTERERQRETERDRERDTQRERDRQELTHT